ncbi:MAG: helix-turn-helix domain-containing protein [Deltaproteobacteria bacterium]|nr:helix-turn-helix domain-containing protein [Deltaproteobacteria bacterium]
MSNDHADLRLIILAEEGAILQLSKRTLIKMTQKKEVPAFKVGGRWRIRESQLRNWVKHKENGVFELQYGKIRNIRCVY